MLKHFRNTRYNNNNKKLPIVLTKCFYLFTFCKTLNPIRKVRVQLRVKPIKRAPWKQPKTLLCFIKRGYLATYDPPKPPLNF